MRRIAIAILPMIGAGGLPGCNPAPTDPYTNMKMLTPEEAGAGATARVEDPVLQEEKDYNARFATKKP